MDVLVAKGVTKVYRGRTGPVEALRSVDLSIGRGRLFAFLGRNGAGKTTFIKIAATLLLPTAGSVTLFGEDVVSSPNRIREQIAVVPQEGRPFFHLTAREHIREYLRTRGFSAETTNDRVEEMIASMGLEPHADIPANALSGGLQQRTLVAMILATEAPFLFLDEPTLGMDPFARRQVWQVIRRVCRKGSTVLLTTHYLDEAEQLSEELAVIEDGRILYRGTAGALKSTLHREVRLEFGPGVAAKELEPYGRIYSDKGKVILLTSRSSVRELTELALSRSSEVAMGPVTLEEAFLELVGRPIEEDET
ncbi:MAG TPA: ABC transporter ATP-binding protein [Thermoplasmata archaeon]|nr:ABC transporter ATP-binding protein [Thermoplasmata archaeon]